MAAAINDAVEQIPRPLGKLFIQMSGAPGSGKSTTAKLLAKSIKAVVIDQDMIKTSALDHEMKFKTAAAFAYDLCWKMAEHMMEHEHSIIIDSACNYDEILAGGTALAQKYGYSYLYVECKAKDIGMLDERLRARSALRSQRRGVHLPPSDAGDASHGENGRALFQRWIDEPKRPDKNCIVVKSSGNLEECRDYILEQIHLLLSM